MGTAGALSVAGAPYLAHAAAASPGAASRRSAGPATENGMSRWAYSHRNAFGPWINDMRLEPWPEGSRWPYPVLDDVAVDSIVRCLELASWAGYNEFSVFGLFATHGWPVDLESVLEGGRKKRVERIINTAHKLGIKVLPGIGIYNWGFQQIIAAHPELKGTSTLAMCASRDESWEWMRKVIDFQLAEFDLDGFHLEPADQGRCECDDCRKMRNVEYYNTITARTADYIRSKWPDKVLMVNLCGYSQPQSLGSAVFDETERDQMLELGKHIDYLIDAGHYEFYIAPEHRREFVDKLECDFGTSGGMWWYGPPGWDRLRWFLPYGLESGRLLKAQYRDGCTAVEYYMAPVNNPGVEVTIAVTGRMLTDISRDPEFVLYEVIEKLYEPTPAACHELTEAFIRAENAYFSTWDISALGHGKSPANPGELFYTDTLGPASKDTGPWYLYPAATIGETRAAYKKAMVKALDTIEKIRTDVARRAKIERLKVSIENTIADIEAVQKQYG